MSELPRWDVVPERLPLGELPIPKGADADEDWCAMVNYLYGGPGDYRTELMADSFLVSKATAEGRIIPGEYSRKEPTDNGEPSRHQIIGLFTSISIRRHFETGRSRLRSVPYIRLAQAHDLDSGVPLYRFPGQHVLVPLVKIEQIILERDTTG